MNGFIDKPTSEIKEDSFEIKQYIEGLSDFILECYTPMTIAIQGDWGSGKTSMMNMIKEKLGDRVVTSWFNTWQYSQFNMGDNLAISFFSRLISDLETEQNQKTVNVKKFLKTFSRFAITAGVIATDKFVSGKAAEMVEEKFVKTSEPDEIDMPQAINDLKDHFQEVVDNKIKQAGKERLVIFIDDLDRLHPGKAVELLEVLKLFLDCDKCVFVLAIDYAVVSQGVKQKYGELIGEEKGKSFFDKIIQVPFKMPVAQYDIKNYVRNSLQALNITVSDQEVEIYVKLIRKSVGCNPRAMKRLFNAFLLLNKIAANNVAKDDTQRKTLFAILCLQLSFESIYNYIIQNAQDCYDGNLLKSLAEIETYTEGDDAERLVHELNLNSDTDIANAADFMSVFVNVIDQNGDGEIAKSEIDSFISTLHFSTITANTSTTSESENNPEKDYRYYNRNIIKDTLVAIQGSYTTGDFKIYQTRTDRTDNNFDWKKYYAGGYKSITTSFGNVDFYFKIATNLRDKESTLSLLIRPAYKTDRYKFVNIMNEWYSEQNYGFNYSENPCEYYLADKIVDARSRDEIIQYFTSIVPSVSKEIDNFLKVNKLCKPE